MPEPKVRHTDRLTAAVLEDRAEARGGEDFLTLEEYARLCICRERLLIRAARKARSEG
jgi:hypothetical protein